MIAFGSFSAVSATEFIDEQWTPTDPQGEGLRSLYIADGATLNREPSNLRSMFFQNGQQVASYQCESLDSPKCIEATDIIATAVLPPCDAVFVSNCIESVYAIDPAGVKIEGVNPVYYPTSVKTNFAASAKNNLPHGGSATIWSIPNVVHGGNSSNYVVQVFTQSGLRKQLGEPVINQTFSIYQLTAAIIPVTQVSGSFNQQVVEDSSSLKNGATYGIGSPSRQEWRNCAIVGDGDCQLKEKFPEGYRFGLSLRIARPIKGWVHGRIFDPEVNISIASDGSQRIGVLASPVVVPVVGEWFKWDELTEPIKEYILAGRIQGGAGSNETRFLATGRYQEMVGSSGIGAINALSLWLPQLKDKASASPTVWAFSNLSDSELELADSCIRNATDLAGFVTTNATAYSAGPPVFNRETMSLDYTVIAPHYTSKGAVFKGSYDLRIKSSIARCIYGFTNAPIQATISIISSDGTAQVATEQIREKDGWISLSAKGFEYSSPTIRVNLSQEAPPAPEPTATPTTSIKPVAKKSSITCTKGKVVKKVTAVKPKCPTGFKKKVSS